MVEVDKESIGEGGDTGATKSQKGKFPVVESSAASDDGAREF